MQCPDCGYLFQPFETDCPRCLRLQEQRAKAAASLPPPIATSMPPPSGASTPLPPSAPLLAADAAPNQPKLAWMVAILSIANARLLVLVAFLSIACIYLSGIVIGRKMAINNEEDLLPPRPVVQRMPTPVVRRWPAFTPRPQPANPPPMSFTTVTHIQEIEDYLAALGRLDARKRQTPQNRPVGQVAVVWSEEASSAPRQAGQAGATVAQMQHYVEQWIQIRQDLLALPCPPPCYTLRDAYQRYTMTVEISYKGLARALQARDQNLPNAQDMLATVYRNAPVTMRQSAAEADRELASLCMSQRLNKPFTIE